MDVILLFMALAVGHFLADYPLQGDFLSRAKNRYAPVANVPWVEAMTAHTAIHGGMVWLLTGYPLLGVAEMFFHWMIDDMKCAGMISFEEDQRMHAACKILWVIFAVIFGLPEWVTA